VAMGMILTHDVGDRTRRLHIFAVPVIAALVAGIEDAPVDRLQPVAHVGQRARHDHAPGVVEIAALHLLDDGDRVDTFGQVLRPARRGLVSQWRSRFCWESFTPYIGTEPVFPNRRDHYPASNLLLLSISYTDNHRHRPIWGSPPA